MQFVIIILHVHDLSLSELLAIYTLYTLFFLLPPPKLYIFFFSIFWYLMILSLKLVENRFVSAECIELAVCQVCLVTAFNHLIPQYQETCQEQWVTHCHINSCIFYFIFRGESILLFLVQTVGRQSVEQRQYRAARPRSASASSRKTPSSDLGMLIKIY